MKKMIATLRDKYIWFVVMMASSSAWAELPRPPESDMASSSKNWIDVGGGLINKVLSVACVSLGAIILLGVAAGILKSYHVAHEKQDLGHFFKMLVVGLLAAAIGIGLVYAGSQIVGMKG